jgi:hypothetical protein
VANRRMIFNNCYRISKKEGRCWLGTWPAWPERSTSRAAAGSYEVHAH